MGHDAGGGGTGGGGGDGGVIGGIAPERALLVSGQPTAIIAGVHEHRHALPQLAGVLAEVARRLGPGTIDAEPATLVPPHV